MRMHMRTEHHVKNISWLTGTIMMNKELRDDYTILILNVLQ